MRGRVHPQQADRHTGVSRPALGRTGVVVCVHRLQCMRCGVCGLLPYAAAHLLRLLFASFVVAVCRGLAWGLCQGAGGGMGSVQRFFFGCCRHDVDPPAAAGGKHTKGQGHVV
jgi:hypothetical protein